MLLLCGKSNCKQKKPYLILPLQRHQVGFLLPLITDFNMKKINYQVGKQKHFPLVYSKGSAFVVKMTDLFTFLSWNYI